MCVFFKPQNIKPQHTFVGKINDNPNKFTISEFTK